MRPETTRQDGGRVVLGGVPRGVALVPGDKSLSHRALLLAGLAEGRSRLRGLLPSGDAAATAAVLRGLGVAVLRAEGAASDADLDVVGAGLEGLREPEAALDCGRSGTTLRLLAGLLAGRPFVAVCTGDPQLLRRPMARVLQPLQQMGAQVLARGEGKLAPFAIRGGGLRGADFATAVASAQVKSALLLAGLQAAGTTRVREPTLSRDHSERLLAALGAPVWCADGAVVCERLRRPWPGFDLEVPGDPSSAAFLLGAAAMVPGGAVRVPGVAVNPTRVAFLDVLRRAGAEVAVGPSALRLGEPVADVEVAAPKTGQLRGVDIGGAEIPLIIDELPLLAVVLAWAAGPSRVSDAAELRVKESDRISAVVAALRAAGAAAIERPDGFELAGGGLRPAAAGEAPRRVATRGDHRLAMAFSLAGLPASIAIDLDDAACAADSFPGYFEVLAGLGVRSEGVAAG